MRCWHDTILTSKIQWEDSSNVSLTGSGEEYTASVDENTAYVEYLGATMEIDECEMYFPVNTEKTITVQVLNPDGEDTVMAEFDYVPDTI